MTFGVQSKLITEQEDVANMTNNCQYSLSKDLLNFAWGVAEAKCSGHGRLSVCLSLAAFPHYCTDPAVTWGNGSGAL